MALEPGTTLRGRYRIERRHRLGRMGAVYLATDLSLNVSVAVKENLYASPEYVQQFKREATFLATFRHAHIPRATDHFILAGEGQYFVMGFLDGHAADEWIDHSSPSPAEIIQAFRGVFDALGYIHNLQPPVIHRDVEPTNIIVSKDRESFLVDFGLAKTLTEKPSPPSTDPRSDQYSLAATLYTLLTRQDPADAMDRALGKVDLMPLRSLNADVPLHIDRAVRQAMSIRREDRFADIEEFWRALVAKS